MQGLYSDKEVYSFVSFQDRTCTRLQSGDQTDHDLEKNAGIFAPLKRERFLVILAAFLFYYSAYSAQAVLPLHIQNLGGSNMTVGAVMALINIVSFIAKWVTGALQDKYGSKPFLAGAVMSLSCVTLLYGLATSIPILMVIGVFHGISLGTFAISAVAQVVSNVRSEALRTSALSMFSMAHLTAGAIAPGLSLTLAGHIKPSAALRWASLGAVVAGLPVYRMPMSRTMSETGGGTLASIKTIITDKAFRGASFLYLTWAICYGSVYSFLPLFGNDNGIMNVGTFHAAYALVNLMGRPFVGYLVLHLGMRRLTSVSSILVVISMFLVAISRTMSGLGAAGIFFGLGSFALYPCLAAVATGQTMNHLGMSIAVFKSSLELGQVVSSIVVGAISSKLGWLAAYGTAGAAVCLGLLVYINSTKSKRTCE